MNTANKLQFTDADIDQIAKPYAGLGGIEDYRAFARAILSRQSMMGCTPQADDALTPLDYRAQGREEALDIILAEDPENPFADQTNSVFGGEDYSTEWDESALRELLHIGDRKHDAFDRAEAQYYECLGKSQEAERMMRMVEQAPLFKPLHDYLAKQESPEAWDLMRQLKEAAAPQEQAERAAVPDEIRFLTKKGEADA